MWLILIKFNCFGSFWRKPVGKFYMTKVTILQEYQHIARLQVFVAVALPVQCDQCFCQLLNNLEFEFVRRAFFHERFQTATVCVLIYYTGLVVLVLIAAVYLTERSMSHLLEYFVVLTSSCGNNFVSNLPLHYILHVLFCKFGFNLYCIVSSCLFVHAVEHF